jgi:hypothetical protein
MNSKAIRYIIIAIIVQLLCIVAVILLFRFFQEKLPAPHLSNSISFDEKARWLRNNLAGRCGVLIIGSSIALNNVYSKELEMLYPGEAIINTASWGMGIEDSYLMLLKIIPLCRPKAIILLTNYVDFFSASNKEIVWDRFEKYLRGSSIELTYLQGFNLFSFASELRDQNVRTAKGRRIYGSLKFDDTGTVNLECEPFETDPHRWEGYKFDNFSPSKIRPAAIDAITSIAATADQINSQLIVVTTPMRQIAELTVYPDFRAEFWSSVKRRVERSNGIYIRVSGTDGFDDKFFADFQHLNECGAKKLTNRLTREIMLIHSH